MVKHVWDELLTEAGADILYYVYGCTAYIENICAKGVIGKTRAGRQVIRADRVIDCTGDGIVAAQSGVGFDAGDGEDPWAMACTKVFRMDNLRRRGERFTEEELAGIRKNLEAARKRGEFTTPVVTTIDRLMGYIRGWHWELLERRNETLSVCRIYFAPRMRP